MSNDIEAGYVFLNDGESFSSEEGAFVLLLNEQGADQLNTSNEIRDVSYDNIITRVSLTELIDCWRDRMRG